jgi:hypothetical protein
MSETRAKEELWKVMEVRWKKEKFAARRHGRTGELFFSCEAEWGCEELCGRRVGGSVGGAVSDAGRWPWVKSILPSLAGWVAGPALRSSPVGCPVRSVSGLLLKPAASVASVVQLLKPGMFSISVQHWTRRAARCCCNGSAWCRLVQCSDSMKHVLRSRKRCTKSMYVSMSQRRPI